MRVKKKSRIISAVLSSILAIGCFSGLSEISLAGPAVPAMIVFKTESGQTVGQPEPIAVWNYDEEKNTYREDGEELSIVSNEEFAFSGKRPRPGDIANKMKVTKSIPIKDVANYFEGKTGKGLDRENLVVDFTAMDNFGYASEYYKLVNKEGRSDMLYINGMTEYSYTSGVPVDAVLALDMTTYVPATNDDFSENTTISGTPRLYSGVPADATNYNSIANFGYASPSNVVKVVFKEHFSVNLLDGDETLRTEDSVYMKNSDGNAIKLFGNSQVIQPGTKVEFRTTRMSVPKVSTKVLSRSDTSREVEVEKSEEGIYSFIMPNRDVNIKLEETEHTKSYLYLRMEHPRKIESTVEVDFNLRAFNIIDYPENNPLNDDVSGGVETVDIKLAYNPDEYNYLKTMDSRNIFENGPMMDFPFVTGGVTTRNIIFAASDPQVDYDNTRNILRTGKLFTASFTSISDSKEIDGFDIIKGSEINRSVVDEEYPGFFNPDNITYLFEKDLGEVTIPFETEYIDDAELLAGEIEVVQEGENGRGRKFIAKYIEKWHNHVENYDEWIKVTQAPVAKIVKYGTKAPEAVVVKENTDIEKLPSVEYINKVDNDKKTIDVYRVKEDGKKVTDSDIEAGVKATDDSEQTYKSTDLKTLKVTSEDKSKTADYTINLIDRDQKAPEGIETVPTSKKGASDGKITGVDSSMEYKAKDDAEWKSISGTEVAGLKVGTYEVRYKAKEGYKASPATEVTIRETKLSDNTDIEAVPDAEYIGHVDNDNKTIDVYRVKADGTPVTDQDIELGVEAEDNSDITLKSTDLETLEVTAEDGNSTATYKVNLLDRDQDIPKGLRALPVSRKGRTDGSISGVDSSMEYKAEDSEEWIEVEGDKIEGLEEGVYHVRYAAKFGYNPSLAVEVKVGVRPSGGGSGGGTITPPDTPDTPDAPSDEVALEGPYIKGYPDKTFGPDRNITRAEAAAMVARILSKNADLPRLGDKYPDVTDGWYREAVDYMTDNGYMKGYPNGDFKPDDKMTRAEFAEMIKKITKEKIKEEIAFTDIKGHWALDAINLASTRGLILGYPDDTFKPDNNITRAEVVTILNRLYDIEATDEEKEDIIKNADNPFTDLNSGHWGYADIIIASTDYKFKK